ncbi:MAG: hypothetical protein FJ303_14745 [Planctomycetes bacterium]|nr:hypothetical protein [Planctomycetota bacterium]
MCRTTRWIVAALLLFVSASFAASYQAGGPNFDSLADGDRKVLQERFIKEIWPLFLRGEKNGCVGCHNGKIVSALKMSGNPEKDFRMLLKDGFFLKGDAGSMLARIESKDRKRRMPPPGKMDPWTKEEMDILRQFVIDIDKKQAKKF